MITVVEYKLHIMTNKHDLCLNWVTRVLMSVDEQLQCLYHQKQRRLDMYKQLALLNRDILSLENKLVCQLRTTDLKRYSNMKLKIRKKTVSRGISQKMLLQSCQQFLISVIGTSMTDDEIQNLAKNQCAYIWKQRDSSSRYTIQFQSPS